MENIVNALCKQAQIFKKGMVIIWKDLTLTEKY